MFAQSTKIGHSVFLPVLIGDLGALIGSIVSVRLMAHFTKKELGEENLNIEDSSQIIEKRTVREGSVFHRLLTSILDGGRIEILQTKPY